MATILDKDITRESTVKFNDREIQVTLTADQQISFKLKGMKSGVLSISIEELYAQLIGAEAGVPVKQEKAKPLVIQHRVKGGEYNGGPMVPLNKLRSMVLTTKMDMPVKLELEAVICDMLREEIKL
jgi:hypothetical protein